MSEAVTEFSDPLRPCPFCGGAALRVEVNPDNSALHRVWCLSCFASGPPAMGVGNVGALLAADAWNGKSPGGTG